ncbi:MAG TPA: FG-GAP-like repeat-containing protein [Pyrinomonadaceae bacterium]|jgi:uncharacterized delta-60 repeat protein
MLSYLPLNVSGFIKLTFAFVWLALFILLFNFPSRAARAGDFDSSFGMGGMVGLQEPHRFLEVALQPDGKILALGNTATGIPFNIRYPVSIMRFQADGNVDASFAANGKLRPMVGADILENASFALQPDGRIIVAGVSSPGTSGPYALVVFRYLANGQSDSTFGNGGIVGFFPDGIKSVRDVLIQPDGKILVSAYLSTGAAGNSALWRFNADGTLDTGFGSGGLVTPGSGSDQTLNHVPNALLLQPGGKILIVGFGSNSFIILRYNADGTLDTTFGNGGKTLTQIQDGSSAMDAAFQPDGKIVLAGNSRDNANNTSNIALARYTAEGALDASFGSGGVVFTGSTAAGFYTSTLAVVIQSNGKIIICGYRQFPQFQTPAMLARFNQSGTLDTSFGVGGYVLNQFFSEGHAVTNDMVLQPDGKLVTVGSGRSDKYSATATLMRHLLNETPDFDFDGDGKSDVSIFRPNTFSEWYWLNSSNNQSNGLQFGNGTDKIVPADFDGDGKSDISVFRNGDWYRVNSFDNSFVAVHFGQTGDLPVPSDYDGDAKADLAVYRAGDWYILNSSNNSFRAEQFGISGDKPILGDFDGDGKNDLAVYRAPEGVWYQMRSRDGFFGVQFGISADKPVAADYDGDGKTDVAVYRPADGVWYLLRSNLGFTATQFGIETDKPVPADYDGDGRTDLAVYRDGNWYLQQSAAGFRAVQFGSANDFPVPNAFVP